MTLDASTLLEQLLEGHPRAIARAITRVENHEPGYRELIGELHRNATGADVVGVTGSPGSGKSTLVNQLTTAYRAVGETVGIIAIDPSSPFSGGALLGDRIRMGAAVGDDGVFVRSMSARGNLGGLSSATSDAIKVLDAAGMDRIIVETVGAGQNEVDIVKTADTVLVLVPPQSGDDIQMLKAGILEIADIFVVNKADLDGANRMVEELLELLRSMPDDAADAWRPTIVETVAMRGEGIDELHETIDDHLAYLDRSGERTAQHRRRFAEEIHTLLRDEVGGLIEGELAKRGGIERYTDAVLERRMDPYEVADDVIGPIRECLDDE